MPKQKDAGKRLSLSFKDEDIALLVRLRHAEELNQEGTTLSISAVFREAIAYTAKHKHGIKV